MLLDAKRFEDFPPVDKLGNPVRTRAGRILGEDKILIEARAQVQAFRNNAPIEWHVATQEKADMVKDILRRANLLRETGGSGIKIIVRDDVTKLLKAEGK